MDSADPGEDTGDEVVLVISVAEVAISRDVADSGCRGDVSHPLGAGQLSARCLEPSLTSLGNRADGERQTHSCTALDGTAEAFPSSKDRQLFGCIPPPQRRTLLFLREAKC